MFPCTHVPTEKITSHSSVSFWRCPGRSKNILVVSFSFRRGCRLQFYLLYIPHGLILYFPPGVVTCCLKWLPGELVSACSDGEVQSLKQKTDFFFPLLSSSAPPISLLRSNHHKNPGIGKKHYFNFTQSSWQSSYLLHQCKQERCLHNCMEKWKEPASLGSCVWQNEAPPALLENMGSGKQQEESQDSGGGKTQRGKKAALKQEKRLLEEKE